MQIYQKFPDRTDNLQYVGGTSPTYLFIYHGNTINYHVFTITYAQNQGIAVLLSQLPFFGKIFVTLLDPGSSQLKNAKKYFNIVFNFIYWAMADNGTTTTTATSQQQHCNTKMMTTQNNRELSSLKLGSQQLAWILLDAVQQCISLWIVFLLAHWPGLGVCWLISSLAAWQPGSRALSVETGTYAMVKQTDCPN